MQPERAELYLFVFPAFQIWLCVMPILGARNIRLDGGADGRTTLRTMFPSARPVKESIGLHRTVFAGLVVFELACLVMTIYRSVLIAAKVV